MDTVTLMIVDIVGLCSPSVRGDPELAEDHCERVEITTQMEETDDCVHCLCVMCPTHICTFMFSGYHPISHQQCITTSPFSST